MSPERRKTIRMNCLSRTWVSQCPYPSIEIRHKVAKHVKISGPRLGNSTQSTHHNDSSTAHTSLFQVATDIRRVYFLQYIPHNNENRQKTEASKRNSCLRLVMCTRGVSARVTRQHPTTAPLEESARSGRATQEERIERQ